MRYPCSLVWFRNDLRVSDHEALTTAITRSEVVYPVYCIDPRDFRPTPYGFPKTGAHRAAFLKETLLSLQRQFLSKGSRLHIAVGKPEDILPEIAAKTGATALFYHHEITSEEIAVETRVKASLPTLSCHAFYGASLIHPDDLPFQPTELPNVFTEFRKRVEKRLTIRPLFAEPKTIPTPEGVSSEFPPLPEWYPPEPSFDPRHVMRKEGFLSGEAAARARLMHYLWDTGALTTYKDTRNGLLGADYSSKFSPWLALGTISPRQIYHEVKRFEKERISNQSTYWLIFELLWRDFFRFYAMKFGNAIFYPQGTRHTSPRKPSSHEAMHAEAWCKGKTGYPFVDANMRELNATGFMSNRGRQNVASFLVHTLGVDWRWGAAYFESCLIDYDVCSNYGNWNYVAGVGADPREHRVFNVIKQSRQYDPNGDYLRRWLPEIAHYTAPEIHFPHRTTSSLFASDQQSPYPMPIVPFYESQ